jgi:hypothetical protein
MKLKLTIAALLAAFFLDAQCDTTIRLKASGDNYSYVEWYLNGQFISFDEYINVIITDTGSYNVDVIAYGDQCEIRSSTKFKISSCNDCYIYIPNAVTPNEDGTNDKWTPKSLCDFKFQIYNRWGEHIYSGPPPWSAPVQNDVYTYLVFFKGKRYLGKIVVVN